MVSLFPQEQLPQNGGAPMDLTSLRMAALQSKKNQGSRESPQNASDTISEREEGEISDVEAPQSPLMPGFPLHNGLYLLPRKTYCKGIERNLPSTYQSHPWTNAVPKRGQSPLKTQSSLGRTSTFTCAIRNKKQTASVAMAELIKLGFSFSDFCAENIHPEALVDILQSLKVPESYYLVPPPGQIPMDEIDRLIHSRQDLGKVSPLQVQVSEESDSGICSPYPHTTVYENITRTRRPVAADFVSEPSRPQSNFGNDSCDNIIIELSDDEAHVSKPNVLQVIEKPLLGNQLGNLETPRSISAEAKRRLQETEEEIKRMTSRIAQLEKGKKNTLKSVDLPVSSTVVEDERKHKLAELQNELSKSKESLEALNAIVEESQAMGTRIQTELESVESHIFEKEARLAILKQDISHLELQLEDARSNRDRLCREKKETEEALTTHSANAERAFSVHEQKALEVKNLQQELASSSAQRQANSTPDIRQVHPQENNISKMDDVQMSFNIPQPVFSEGCQDTWENTSEFAEDSIKSNSPVSYEQPNYQLGVTNAINKSFETQSNHNYTSPLRTFKSFRFHPNYLKWVSSGYGSLTYSHNLNPNDQLCQYECSGGICNDDSCNSVHFDKIRKPDYEILIELGQAVEGQTEEEQLQYRNGLRKIITQMRRSEKPDLNKIAKAIVDYRRQFLGVHDRVIVL